MEPDSSAVTRQQKFVFDKYMDKLPKAVQDVWKEVVATGGRGSLLHAITLQHCIEHVALTEWSRKLPHTCGCLLDPPTVQGKQGKKNEIINAVVPKDVSYASLANLKYTEYEHLFTKTDAS